MENLAWIRPLFSPIFIRIQETDIESILTIIDSKSGSESASFNSTVRSYPYPVSRTPTYDSIYGEGMGKVRVDK